MPFSGKQGCRIFHRWAGRENGRVIVLSHSLGSSSDLWERQVEGWGDRFRILLYDHRGHGQSDRPKGKWTIDDFGNDLVELLDELELENVDLCGVSLGGMVGLWLAQQAPDRVKRLVVANTSAYTEDPGLLKKRIDLIASKGVEAIAEDVLERWFTPSFHSANPEVINSFRSQLLATSAETYRVASGAICDLDLRSGLSEITSPTLVITGTRDRATPPSWGEAIAAAIPGAKLMELAAAHLSNVEAAAAFNDAVSGFLGTA